MIELFCVITDLINLLTNLVFYNKFLLRITITTQSHSDNRFVFSDNSFVFQCQKHNRFTHVNIMADLFMTRITFLVITDFLLTDLFLKSLIFLLHEFY